MTRKLFDSVVDSDLFNLHKHGGLFMHFFTLVLLYLVNLYMAHVCSGCESQYGTARGLEFHQKNCDSFIDADASSNTILNAFERYEKKQALKKRKRETTAQIVVNSEQVRFLLA